MSMPWFRMYAEFATDPKVQTMTEAMQRRFVMLLCMQCDDKLFNATEYEILFLLRISKREFQTTKQLFKTKGLIKFSDDDEKHMIIVNWENRQFRSDKSAERVSNYRKRHSAKQDNNNENVTLQDGYSNVTPPLQKRYSNGVDTDADTDADNINNPLTPASGETDADAPDGKIKTDAKIDKTPYLEIVALYHKHLPMLPKVKIIGDQLKKQLKARFKENPSLDWFDDYFKHVSEIDMYTGKKEGFDWMPNLFWLTGPKNIEKALNQSNTPTKLIGWK